MKINSILFDFDGTLANTNGLVIASWKHVYRVLKNIDQREEEIRKTFGEPLGVSMEKAFPEVPVETAIDIYRGHQKDIYREMIEPFPGMVELVKKLRAEGYKTAITTSRLYNSTMVGLRKFGLENEFDAIVTADDTEKHKPDPEPVLITLEKLGIAADQALMVGDSMFDIKCAHNAGVKAVLVGWAEAVSQADLKGADQPDFYIDRPEELLNII